MASSPRIPVPGIDTERDRIRTPWGWLRGFAWFLLAWPLFGLLALGEMEDFEWDMILIAMLAPAGIGALLMLLDWGLTRLFGVAAATAAQPVPSLLRDLSNLGLALAILMGINTALVLSFEEDNLFTRPEYDAGPIAAWVLAGCLGAMLVFRGLGRLLHGPARDTDLGEGWDDAPSVLRLFGYLTLIPMLLVCTVMIDYTLRSKPGFGLTAWIVLPLILLLGLRSAMARSPRYWARDPWEAWIRAQSLAFPWWVIGTVIGVGTCAFFVLAPLVMPDDEISFAGRIIVGVLLGPIGLLGVWVTGKMLWQQGPLLIRRWRVARTLTRDRSALLEWKVRTTAAVGKAPPGHEVLLRLRDGRSLAFEASGDDPPLVRWLEANA